MNNITFTTSGYIAFHNLSEDTRMNLRIYLETKKIYRNTQFPIYIPDVDMWVFGSYSSGLIEAIEIDDIVRIVVADEGMK